MNRFFSESHDIYRASVKRFIEREITPFVDQWEEEGTIPLELHKKAGDAGHLGVGYPEELGGTPSDLFHTVVYTEEMTRCGSIGLINSLGCHNIALPPIVAVGTEKQKNKYVPPVLAGNAICALAITEPSGGSDVANLRTKAERKGDKYIVNGSKTFITSGTRANFITAAVRTGGPGAGGVSLLIIETNTPGFSVSKKIDKMGWLASDTAELFLQDVEVPMENRIGEENKAFKYIMLNFQKERLYLAVMAHGVAEYALEQAIKYAKERVAFGKTLSGFQVTRHKIAEMATQVKISKDFNYNVAEKIIAGKDVTLEVSMAKNFATKVCDKVVYDAVQIHGGYGYCREYAVEKLYRDSRIFSIGGGTYEIMNEIISKKLGLDE